MSVRRPELNGKAVSARTSRRLKQAIRMPSTQLKRLMARIFDQHQKLDDPKKNALAREEFVFHMTDWLHDLELLTEVYAHPEVVDRKEAGHAVYGFLIHALGHLMAAGRLVMD